MTYQHNILLFPHFLHHSHLCTVHSLASLNLKGTVLPKMNTLSSFSHLQVVTNLYEFIRSVEHKGRYFERFEKLKVWGTIDFYSRKENTITTTNNTTTSQWCPRTALFPSLFSTSSSVSCRTKTLIQVCNHLRVTE